MWGRGTELGGLAEPSTAQQLDEVNEEVGSRDRGDGSWGA